MNSLFVSLPVFLIGGGIVIGAGLAKSNRIVLWALHALVKESLRWYYDVVEIMGILIDRFMEMEIPTCLNVLDIFGRISKQFEELRSFYGWCRTAGVANTIKYPEVEKITQKKLEVMKEFIRDKSVLAQRRNAKRREPKRDQIHVVEQQNGKLAGSNALTVPELSSILVITTEETEEKTKPCTAQTEVDILNLMDDDVPTTEHQGDELALALFDDEIAAQTLNASEEEQGDWETTLVESASKLAHQKPSLGGEFDMQLLNGMNPRAPAYANVWPGCASSIAVPGSLAYGQLALPAPVASACVVGGGDPFKASAAVALPSYVEMSEMEKQQQLLAQEPFMWQQYHYLGALYQ